MKWRSNRAFMGIIYALYLCILSSCGPKVTTKLNSKLAPLDYREQVVVYGMNQALPENSEEIGEVHVGDSGFSAICDFNTVLNKATEEARKAGGNAIKIYRHVPPNFASTCHRISVKILKIEKVEDYFVEEDSWRKNNPDLDYALLHIYRFGGMGALIGYDLYLGDSLLCRVKHNWKETIQITKAGSNSLWAKTETKEEIPINIELGKEYYVRCGIGTGILVGRPTITLVDEKSGKYEFESIK